MEGVGSSFAEGGKLGKSDLQSFSKEALRLLEEIGFPQSMPEDFSDPAFLETHISLVILGRDSVLKFKKPVDFGFVNHRSLGRRWKSAVNEVVLNRRLSDGVYKGICAVFGQGPNARLGELISEPAGSSAPKGAADVAVVMNRLPADARLDHLIRERRVDIYAHIKPLAQRIYSFHKALLEDRASYKTASSGEGLGIANAVRENLAVLAEGAASRLSAASRTALKHVAGYSEEFLKNKGDILESRIKSGFVVDGHGDLRAEHVYFLKHEIAVIDCIEFSDELRRVDVLNDLAFLRMDLDRLKSSRFASALIDFYASMSHLKVEQGVLDFFTVYRAMVRAKVALLSEQSGVVSEQHNADEVGDRFSGELNDVELYLALASRYTHGITKPCIIVVCGPMGCGKSTLANFLCRLSAASILRSDQLRKKLCEKSKEGAGEAFGEGIYSSGATEKTYQLLLEGSSFEVSKGNPVIADATYSKRKHRDAVRGFARSIGCSCLFAMCRLDKDILKQRLIKRSEKGTSISDGRVELLDAHLDAFEWPNTDENNDVVMIDAGQPTDLQAEDVLVKLGEILEQEPGRGN